MKTNDKMSESDKQHEAMAARVEKVHRELGMRKLSPMDRFRHEALRRQAKGLGDAHNLLLLSDAEMQQALDAIKELKHVSKESYDMAARNPLRCQLHLILSQRDCDTIDVRGWAWRDIETYTAPEFVENAVDGLVREDRGNRTDV